MNKHTSYTSGICKYRELLGQHFFKYQFTNPPTLIFKKNEEKKKVSR